MISEFWDWFLRREADLRSKAVDAIPIGELEEHLFRVCRVDWEIGPGGDGRTSFSVSPSKDDPKGYLAAKLLIDSAPGTPHWLFSLFKPPRDWTLEFELRINGGDQNIDAKRWEFVLYRFRDGTFDVVFKPDESCRDLGMDNLLNAATVILDGELGEATRIALIGGVSIASNWKPHEQDLAAMLEVGALKRIVMDSIRE